MKGFAVTGPVAEGLVAAIGRKVFAPVLDEGAPGMPIEEPVGFIPPGTTLIQFGLVIEASMSVPLRETSQLYSGKSAVTLLLEHTRSNQSGPCQSSILHLACRVAVQETVNGVCLFVPTIRKCSALRSCIRDDVKPIRRNIYGRAFQIRIHKLMTDLVGQIHVVILAR